MDLDVYSCKNIVQTLCSLLNVQETLYHSDFAAPTSRERNIDVNFVRVPVYHCNGTKRKREREREQNREAEKDGMLIFVSNLPAGCLLSCWARYLCQRNSSLGTPHADEWVPSYIHLYLNSTKISNFPLVNLEFIWWSSRLVWVFFS